MRFDNATQRMMIVNGKYRGKILIVNGKYRGKIFKIAFEPFPEFIIEIKEGIEINVSKDILDFSSSYDTRGPICRITLKGEQHNIPIEQEVAEDL